MANDFPNIFMCESYETLSEACFTSNSLSDEVRINFLFQWKIKRLISFRNFKYLDG